MVENQGYLVSLSVPREVPIEVSTPIVCLRENPTKVKSVEDSNATSVVLPSNNELTNTNYIVYCRHCGLNFDNMKEYETHVSIKNTMQKTKCKRKHVCTYCPASFNRNDHLKRHVTSLHMNTRYNICPVCHEDCKTNDTLLKHIKMHPNPAAFNCRNCSQKFKSLQDLVDHESTHIWPELHSCNYCSKTFKRRDHMLRHIQSSHFQKYTECPICNQKFKRKDHAVRHVREKHKMPIPGGFKELF